MVTTATDTFRCRALEPKDSDVLYPVPLDAVFQLGPEIFRQFKDAPDLQGIAATLISRDYSWASDLSLRLLWKRNGGLSSGRTVFGRCVKTSALVRHLSDADYIIWLAADAARDYRLSNLQVEAFLHQELGHMAVPSDGDDPNPGIVGYDFEGFTQTVLLYGAFSPSLHEAAATFQQLPLFEAAAFRADVRRFLDAGGTVKES